ncbi:MAG: M28 family metallopeptidase [Clostridia bacterium]|nr:M28 family metallopeptidase [Clostridia bacterium]
MRKLIFIILIVCLISSLLPLTAYAQTADWSTYSTYDYLSRFINQCGKRVAGTSGEVTASNWLRTEFASMSGLEVSVQPFDYTDEDNAKASSSNVIAIKQSSQATDTQVIICAHYDCVMTGEGVFDNGSGVAVLLAVADSLVAQDLPFDVVFVAMGAEEAGMYGSQYYVSQMTQADIGNTLLVINIDSVSVGDYIYVYGEDVKTDYTQLFVNAGQNNDYDVTVKSKPLYKDIQLAYTGYGGYPYYQTAQLSDHSSFRSASIPTVFFFSGNYDVSLGYQVSSQSTNEVMHTSSDTLSYINEKLGISHVLKMETVVQSITKTLTSPQNATIISTAREHMVGWFWLQTWPVCIVVALLFIVSMVIALRHLNKLRKQAILDDYEVKTDTLFKSVPPDDIYKL